MGGLIDEWNEKRMDGYQPVHQSWYMWAGGWTNGLLEAQMD